MIAKSLTRFIERYMDAPALSGWYLADEPSTNPTLGPLSAATAERLYRAVKAEDPAHPVAIAFGTSDDIERVRNAYDIAMWDEYPAGRTGRVHGHGRLEAAASSSAQRRRPSSGFDPDPPGLRDGTDRPAQSTGCRRPPRRAT